MIKLLINKDEKKEERKDKKKKAILSSENYLVLLLQEARKKKQSVHEYFLDKDIIKQPLNEFWEGKENATLVPHSVSR